MSQSANAKLLHDGLEKKDEIITLAAQNSRLTHDFNLVPSFPIFLRFTRAQAHSWQGPEDGEWAPVGPETIWRDLGRHWATCVIKVTFDQVKSK